jgi:hypothetical protein
MGVRNVGERPKRLWVCGDWGVGATNIRVANVWM